MNPYFDNNMNRKRKSDPKKNAAGMLVWIVVALAVLIGVICILQKVFGGESHDTFGSARQERTIHHNLDLAKKTGKINLNGRLYTKEELKQLHL